MPLKKQEARYAAILMAAMGLPEYLPPEAIVREDGREGISRRTFLTLAQEIKLKSFAERLARSIVQQQRQNIERLRAWQKEQGELRKAAADDVRDGKIPLKVEQLEVLAFIRRNSGQALNRLTYLFSGKDGRKRVVFLTTIYFLEACQLIRLDQSGMDKVPRLTSDGNTCLAKWKDPQARFRQPRNLHDWRDVALATLMFCQSGNDSYSLETLVEDAKKRASEIEFDFSGMPSAEVYKELSRGVAELMRTGIVVVTRDGEKEHISLVETGAVETGEVVEKVSKGQETEPCPERETETTAEGIVDDEREGEDVFAEPEAPESVVKAVDALIAEALSFEEE